MPDTKHTLAETWEAGFFQWLRRWRRWSRKMTVTVAIAERSTTKMPDQSNQEGTTLGFLAETVQTLTHYPTADQLETHYHARALESRGVPGSRRVDTGINNG